MANAGRATRMVCDRHRATGARQFRGLYLPASGLRFSASLIVVLLLAFAGVAQETQKFEELPNFHQVNAILYRGAQPKTSGIQRLAQLGIKTVINLRDDDEREDTEAAEVRKAGMGYFNVPLGRLGRPSDEEMERVLALINAPENQPVFIHCAHGADRTGTVIACYRISRDGWTGEAAKKEAKRYGLKFWQRNMKDYIHDYYERQAHSSGVATTNSATDQRRP
jgi:uncharacterized protein (TIGR01244 family)